MWEGAPPPIIFWFNIKNSINSSLPTQQAAVSFCWIIKVFEGLPNFLRGNREGLVDFFNELMRVIREGPV